MAVLFKAVSRRRATSSSSSSRLTLLLLSLAVVSPMPALAEIRFFNGPIAASSNYVHYSEGYIVAPGYVDLSQLTFAVSDDGGSGYAPAPRGRDEPTEAPAHANATSGSTTAPTAAPVKAAAAPVSAAPTAAPVTAAPVTAAPVAAAPVTAAPVTAAPVTAAPVKATPAPVTAVPTGSPVKATAAPVKATLAPVSLTPTAAPVKATAAPVQATAAPVSAAPTAAPVKAAAATEAPVVAAAATGAPVVAAAATAAPVVAAAATATPVVAAAATEAPVKAAAATEAPVKAAVATEAPVKAPPPTEAPVQAPPPTEAPVKAAPETGAPVAAPKSDEGGDGGGRRALGADIGVRATGGSSPVEMSIHRGLVDAAAELEEEAEGNDDIPPPSGASVVDIVFFLQPAECSQSQKGCDWTKLGVGASDDGGNLRWCCTDEAAQLGFCDYDKQAGRLIVDKVTFAGEHRFVTIPPDGDFSGHVQGGDSFNVKDISGRYVMVIANCNDMGRDVNVNGVYSWKSKHGYLPGELFGEMYFFAVTTVVYFLVFVWYAFAMHCNRESTIGIQKWILWTIFLGLLETFFNAGNYFVWNEDGIRVWFALYTGVVLGVMKRAISRCLVVMVSLGWGVVRDTLGDQLKKIIFLGILYVGVSTACECMKTFAIDVKTLSKNQEEELFDAVTILTFVTAAVDVTFYMWILDALNGTMQYLENMSQTTKLRQYLRLRCILLLSILFAVIWAIFGIVNSYMDGMLDEQQQWSIQAAWELNYLMVLIGVACLWRPNKNAKEYAYVMELPSMGDGDDVEFETNADTISDDDGFDNDDNVLKVDSAVDA